MACRSKCLCALRAATFSMLVTCLTACGGNHDGSGSTAVVTVDQRQVQAMACENKLKNQIVNGQIIFTPIGDDAVDSVIQATNAQIAKRTKFEREFRITKNPQKQVTQLSFEEDPESSDASQEEFISHIAQADDSPDWPLTVSINHKLADSSQETTEIAQSFNVDLNCQLRMVGFFSQHLKRNGGSLHVDQASFTISNSHIERKSGDFTIPTDAKFWLIAPITNTGRELEAFIAQVPEKKIYEFGSMDVPFEDIRFKPAASIQGVNLLTGLSETLNSIDLALYANNKFMATTILERGKGVCQHFANVFAAIARATGLPTRIVEGYQLLENQAVAHAWDEIEVQDGVWLPIEPQKSKVEYMYFSSYLPVTVATSLDDPKNADEVIQEELTYNFLSFKIEGL